VAKEIRRCRLTCFGDDIKSQVGATILHRTLVRLCLDRGAIVDETYQLNLGGDTDFQNMTVENRLTSKRISKTEAVTSLVPYNLPTRIGPSDFVPFLKNKKICYISMKTRAFGDRPITISAKLGSRRLSQQRRRSHRPYPSSKNRVGSQNRWHPHQHAFIRV
jgi:myo-inositol-1-phosphate synthase